jgi:hypothetical protein
MILGTTGELPTIGDEEPRRRPATTAAPLGRARQGRPKRFFGNH